MDALREAQEQGRLPAHFTWRQYFNLEPLYYTQDEAGRRHHPPQRELPPRLEERVEVD